MSFELNSSFPADTWGPPPPPPAKPAPATSIPAPVVGAHPYAQEALERAVRMVREAVDGTKHSTLFDAARLMGGFVGGAMIGEEQAFEALREAIAGRQCDDYSGAFKTIRDGLKSGQAAPFDEQTIRQERREYAVRNAPAASPGSAGDVPDRAPLPLTPSGQVTEITLNTQLKNGSFALTHNGVPMIRYGEVMTLIAAPGTGKSNGLEALQAKFVACQLGINVDSFGLEIPDLRPGTSMLVLDNERLSDDILTGMGRTVRRLYQSPGITDSEGRLRGVRVFSALELSVNERWEFLELELITQEKAGQPYSFLLIDGFLDMCHALNDEQLAKESVSHLRSLASRFNLAAIVTAHPNKGSESLSGHLGSYLSKWSRCVLLMRRTAPGSAVREITSVFEQGKLSHSSESVNATLEWDSLRGFFVSCAAPPRKQGRKTSDSEAVLKSLFDQFLLSGMKRVPATVFKQAFMKMTGSTPDTAKDKISSLVDFGLLGIEGKGRAAIYFLPDTS